MGPKFGITRVLRYKVSTKAPQRLLDVGVNFGVRFAYDSGECTGPGDCEEMYRRYGYFVGCNNFEAMYPYPTEKTAFPGGIWYSFPGNGTSQCSSPTGADDCTYSYSWPPEEIRLDELEKANGGHAAFWADADSEAAATRKVQAAAALFQEQYPDSEALAAPACDFDYGKFWVCPQWALVCRACGASRLPSRSVKLQNFTLRWPKIARTAARFFFATTTPRARCFGSAGRAPAHATHR